MNRIDVTSDMLSSGKSRSMSVDETFIAETMHSFSTKAFRSLRNEAKHCEKT